MIIKRICYTCGQIFYCNGSCGVWEMINGCNCAWCIAEIWQQRNLNKYGKKLRMSTLIKRIKSSTCDLARDKFPRPRREMVIFS